MFRIRKQFRFEAAHQLDEAFTKLCSDTIHGHSYLVELFISSERLDKTGMVIDFGELKPTINNLKDVLDHAIILSPALITKYGDSLKAHSKRIIPMDNPTAEGMAEFIFNRVATFLELRNTPLRRQAYSGSAVLFNDPRLEKVRVHETDTGWAEFLRS